MWLSAAHSMEFEYLSDVPVLTMDVNEDFKGSKTKSANMVEKVSDHLKIRNGQIMFTDWFPSKYSHRTWSQTSHQPFLPTEICIGVQ